MNIGTYIRRSILYYRKKHLAVLAGTIISTAVLTGALIIGDSVKHSLKTLVDLRLGETRYALTSGDRHFRSALAADIGKEIKTPVISLLQTRGIAINQQKQTRINQVNIWGIDANFREIYPSHTRIEDSEVVINTYVAEKLQLQRGDAILLRMEKASQIPANAPFVNDDNTTFAVRLTVAAITPNNKMGRFSLKSNQNANAAVFVNKKYLAERLQLSGLSNVMLVPQNNKKNINAGLLEAAIQKKWKLQDAALQIKSLPNNRLEITSNRIFLDEQICREIDELGVENQKILTYLVNTLQKDRNKTPYSFVTATDSTITKKPLNNSQIIINQWLANDLNAKKGDSIKLKYYVIGALRNLDVDSAFFQVSAVIPNQTKQVNTGLMPEFPGLANAGSCSQWETGVPIDLDRIRDKDEEYWNDYRGTPKALISIEMGEKLWKNSYGSATAYRFAREKTSSKQLSALIMSRLAPTDLGFVFHPVYEEGLRAASSGVDFGGLFLSLSFFVIAAGLLLTVLLHALNTESRKAENGILSGLGFTKKQILNIRLRESFIIAIVGGIIGAFVGILYNSALMAGINRVWQHIVRTEMISVHLKPTTLILGAISGIVVSMIAIYFVTRKKTKKPAVIQIKGLPHFKTLSTTQKPLLSYIIFILSLLIALTMSTYATITNAGQNASVFLGAGGFMLMSLSALINIYLIHQIKRKSRKALRPMGFAIKNASRNKSRSLTTIVLLALGTFSILITGANRKTFHGAENDRSSGAGGYLYWTEATVPVPFDLNTKSGREKFALNNDTAIEKVDFVQLYSKTGDDASCLNLNQVSKPEILGVDAAAFDTTGAFSFQKLHRKVNEKHPWQILKTAFNDSVIPAIADQTVLTWGLMKSVGDTLTYLDEKGNNLHLKIVGGLSSSVFQGNVVIDSKLFSKHFPSSSQTKYMLIDGKEKNKSEIAQSLRFALEDHGIELTLARSKLREFYSVTNTYLSIFLLLGGLGVIIGTIGLGIVLLRNLLDRKQEIAALQALGFKRKDIFIVIFYENAFLLCCGLIIGLVSAVIGILPSLLTPAFSIPYTLIIKTLIAILISGILWIFFPALKATRANIAETLKNE